MLHKKLLILFAGVAAALLFYFSRPFGLEEMGLRTISVGIIMIFWWVSEAVAMPVVALLPLVLFPILGIAKTDEAASAYSNPVIYLFFGGFMLGLAIEKWGLHKRIALNIIKKTGSSGDRIVLGFILATGLISMWLSNTATTMMMFPIALSVIAVMEQQKITNGNIRNFSLAIMLAIAYASNIGGVATIIGTPPNVAYASYYFKKYGTEIDFFHWITMCMPISLILLGLLYVVMVKIIFPNHIKADEETNEIVKNEVKKLGSFSTPEKRVLIVFITTALLWITRSFINDAQSWFKLDDTMIAVACAIALFIIPSGEGKDDDQALLAWSDTSKMAWGILLLFGGGICLANALEKAGLIQTLGIYLSSQIHSYALLLVIVIVFSLFIGEIMSNVAQVILFAPVVSSMADAMHINPLYLGIPMTLAASCAGMLPMATPPNAIVFASGHIKMRDMLKVGFVMNVISIIVILIFCRFVMPTIF
jgi:solute carrier family 13 (sodium-dependent dicarboxylate transporter), member 2/3/5